MRHRTLMHVLDHGARCVGAAGGSGSLPGTIIEKQSGERVFAEDFTVGNLLWSCRTGGTPLRVAWLHKHGV